MTQTPKESQENVEKAFTFQQKDPETKQIMHKEDPKVLPKELELAYNWSLATNDAPNHSSLTNIQSKEKVDLKT